MLKKLLFSVCFFLISAASFADEGMWLLMFLKQYNFADMQKKGLKLTAEQIYNVNGSSLKDAVVRMGGGFCTGEIISKDGLLLTNHHCGYGQIQSHSTVEKDYLTNGFWAMNRQEELPNKGLTVSFLVRIEDVSKDVNASLNDQMTEDQRRAKINEVMEQIKKKAVEGTHYDADVRSFFGGNEFYLLVYETFKDVRLVGTPPESIGKFGGDTDNWMWPRHTGDFCLFRVYAGKDGKPAEYSPDNVPLKPRHYFPISLKGVKEGDFTMVMGYPGRTQRYLTSFGVKEAIEMTNPARVKLRETRLNTMKEFMDKDAAVRIQYASKYASISNYWKYFIGETQGLQRLKVQAKKEAEENALGQWIKADNTRTAKYGNVLSEYKTIYTEAAKINLTVAYFGECLFAPEFVGLAQRFIILQQALQGTDAEKIKQTAEALKARLDPFFKDYNTNIDQKITAAMYQMYFQAIDQRPDFFKTIETEYGNDFAKYANAIFANSMFVDKAKLQAFLQSPTLDKLNNDIGFKTMFSTITFIQTFNSANAKPYLDRLEKNNRLFIAATREMNNNKNYYPDANSTMRLTYGDVGDYSPKDGILYNFYTTLEGIIEKEDPTNPEFIVPARLKELYQKKDYGDYAMNGSLPVAFITNNDITGGNSGSPVLNAEGHLIGTAFDGNWEAMSGNIAFEPNYQRCINVDIRYVLFIIDKYAGAKHLVDEMTIMR
ncbi:MAG: S46 family peptidase [Cytophagales bacterium]|nr:MAG: S46 family peptidase [Cytophagales bacterium]